MTKLHKLKHLFLPIALVFILLFLLLSHSIVYASPLDPLLDTLKDLMKPQSAQNVSVESNITLTQDEDGDREISAGDIITFSYTITNTTDTLYKFATLKTNVSTKEINSISNVKGTLSLDVSKDTVIIPNLNILPTQVRKINFEARLNFNKESDLLISTDPELVDYKNSSIIKGQRKEIIAEKMEIDRFNKFVHISQ